MKHDETEINKGHQLFDKCLLVKGMTTSQLFSTSATLRGDDLLRLRHSFRSEYSRVISNNLRIDVGWCPVFELIAPFACMTHMVEHVDTRKPPWKELVAAHFCANWLLPQEEAKSQCMCILSSNSAVTVELLEKKRNASGPEGGHVSSCFQHFPAFSTCPTPLASSTRPFGCQASFE